MKKSGLKILSGAVVLTVILILINSRQTETAKEKVTNPNNFGEAIASQFNDNIRDVSARLIETEKKLEKIQEENTNLQKQLKKPKTEINNSFLEELSNLKEQINALTDNKLQSYSLEENSPKVTGQIKDLDSLIEKSSGSSDSQDKSEPDLKKENANTTPFYTIPAGSDFSKVTLLSALIGEVPVEDKLMQPLFPFTAMVSRGDLMTANGMQLPDDITGMKVNGYAIGVGSFLDNISCVRAYVTSALFVFDDGHFVTIGQEQMKGTAELVNNDSIGYLTTQYGNPCIKGQYITNAPRVLGSLMLAGGIQGVGNALSKWQMSYESEGGTSIATPTGNLSHFAAGGAITEGSEKITDWLQKRIQGSFDMVFVPASVKTPSEFIPNQLNLHFSQTIAIDKEHNGRLLDYGFHKEKHFDNALR